MPADRFAVTISLQGTLVTISHISAGGDLPSFAEESESVTGFIPGRHLAWCALAQGARLT